MYLFNTSYVLGLQKKKERYPDADDQSYKGLRNVD